MEKLEKYKIFENRIRIGDTNVEKEIDIIIENLLKKKEMLMMLEDTIDHVRENVEKVFPEKIDKFFEDLYFYDDEVFKRMSVVKEYIIDGFPSLKDMIEEVNSSMETLKNYMKLKDDNN